LVLVKAAHAADPRRWSVWGAEMIGDPSERSYFGPDMLIRRHD
jgi:hypothetical protein